MTQRYSAPVLDDFQGDPLDSEHSYLTEEAFADELIKLSPKWVTSRALAIDVLRAFDEARLLHPRLRLRLPQAYAWFDWAKQPNPVLETLSEAELDLFEYVKSNASLGRAHYDDPVANHPMQRDEQLAPLLEDGHAAASVTWQAWQIQVGTAANGRVPVVRAFVRSFYAPWQRLHARALLEEYSIHFLADPRHLEPAKLLFADRHDMTGVHLLRKAGHGRGAKLAASLANDGWLTALYRSREIVEWSEGRTRDPAHYAWPDGLVLTSDERWAVERPRLESRCDRLATRWNTVSNGDDGTPVKHGVPAPFCAKVRELLEFWNWAEGQGLSALTDAVFADIFATVDWAIFAYATTFTALDAAVGSIGKGVSLSRVLQPTRSRARRVAEQHLGYLIDGYNQQIGRPKLVPEDGESFLDYLDEHELWAWTVEFAEYLEADRIPGDVNRDRRFLHLRSLALLNEQILVALAEEFGTDADRLKMGTGKVMEPLKAFLSDRMDWRGQVWQVVREKYQLADTSSRAETQPDGWELMSGAARLRSRLDDIADTMAPADVRGAATQILSLAAIRNFGAHRFSRDVSLVHEYGGRMISAVVFSALFYWKLARLEPLDA